MERGCPYLYTGSKFRVIWPSVLIIQRGVATTPLRKICLGKTLRRTRVLTLQFHDAKVFKNTLASWNCFTCRNLFQNGANDMSECYHLKRLFVKKLKILYCSDHPILIKFRQLVINIVIKELQMVFLTSTVINSNGNMKELERKIKCEKLMFW